MYSDLKYLIKPPIDYPEGNNRELSSGLPHSEIHGSKLILSSPWLIAEYHVFHRLLLPRHSPNALLALDLIQKKKDWICEANPWVGSWNNQPLFLNQKHTFPPSILEPTLPMSVGPAWRMKDMHDRQIMRVSVLDLDNSVRFSRDSHGQARKHPCHNPPLRRGERLRSTPHSAPIKQC